MNRDVYTFKLCNKNLQQKKETRSGVPLQTKK